MSLELEVGELKGRMSGLEKEVQDLKSNVGSMDKKLDAVIEYIAEQKGSWKAITVLAGVAGAVVATLVKRFL